MDKITTDLDVLAFCKKHFKYNPNTGEVTLKKRRGSGERYQEGAVLGTLEKRDGYLVIKVMNKKYRLHRLIWLMVHEEFPEVMDHINGNRIDNRLSNLRAVTVLENTRNRRIASNNSSGYPGVAWVARDSKWKATIGHEGKNINLGAYIDIEMAIHMRKAAEKYLMYHENTGNY